MTSPLKKYSFWIREEQAAGLKLVAERDGVRESEQIRRGIDLWLKAKGVRVEAGRRRAATRRRT